MQKAKDENEHLTPALSPFCYRKTRRGGDAPSVFPNHATLQLVAANKQRFSKSCRLSLVAADKNSVKMRPEKKRPGMTPASCAL
jgi:hypothetical protein